MISFESPVGTVTVHADDRLRAIRIGNAKVGTAKSEPPTPLERDTQRQLEEYFAGIRFTFSLPLPDAPSGLQGKVWDALDRIPYGQSVSYGYLARELGLEPGAARAVGGAVGANPILIVRPCHRVLGADGSLTGYAGGLDAKLALLQHEGVLL